MARGMRRGAAAAAWSTDAAPAIETAPAPTPPRAPVVRRPRKFTALLDPDTDARFGRLTAELVAELGPVATRQDSATGRVRTGYDPSRADLLRALLSLAEEDPALRAAVHERVRRDYRDTTT